MKITKFVSIIPLAAVLAAPAMAETPQQSYFGVSVGQANIDDFCDGTEITCDDTPISARLYVGSKLNDLADLEVGYRYIDDAEASGVYSGVAVAAAINGHFVDATLQLGMPESGPFKLHTKLGLMFWRLNYEAAGTDGFVFASVEDDQTGVALRSGLGVSYQVSETVRLKADWDYLINVGDDDTTGETDIHVFSVGPEFSF